MTPAQLHKALSRIYGGELSRWQLCKAFGEDVGMHPDAVQSWLNGRTGIHPLVPLAVEAIEARRAKD